MRCLSRKHEPLMGDALIQLPYKNRFRKIIQDSRPSKLDYVQTCSIRRIRYFVLSFRFARTRAFVRKKFWFLTNCIFIIIVYINGELMHRYCTDALLTIQSSLGDKECAKHLKEDFVGSCSCLFFDENETRGKRSDERIKKKKTVFDCRGWKTCSSNDNGRQGQRVLRMLGAFAQTVRICIAPAPLSWEPMDGPRIMQITRDSRNVSDARSFCLRLSDWRAMQPKRRRRSGHDRPLCTTYNNKFRYVDAVPVAGNYIIFYRMETSTREFAPRTRVTEHITYRSSGSYASVNSSYAFSRQKLLWETRFGGKAANFSLRARGRTNWKNYSPKTLIISW